MSLPTNHLAMAYSKKWKQKLNNLCRVDRSLAPDLFYHRTITFRPSQKWTLLNFIQQTLMSPRLTLANTMKMDIETTHTNSFVHNKCGRLSTGFVRLCTRKPDIILALLLIVLAFLASIQQWRDLKIQFHCVQRDPPCFMSDDIILTSSWHWQCRSGEQDKNVSHI